MSELSWVWYVFILVFLAFEAFLLKTLVDNEGYSKLHLAQSIGLLVGMPYLIAVYGGYNIVPNIPYFILVIALGALGTIVWTFIIAAKDLYISDWEEDQALEAEQANKNDSERKSDDENKDESDDEVEAQAKPQPSKLDKYTLITEEKGEVLLDGYRKPVNPEKLGRAIGSLFSPVGTESDVMDALETLDEASDDEDDDEGDESMLGTCAIYLVYAPAAFIAWQLTLKELTRYGWW